MTTNIIYTCNKNTRRTIKRGRDEETDGIMTENFPTSRSDTTRFRKLRE